MKGFLAVASAVLLASNIDQVAAKPGRSMIYTPVDAVATDFTQVLVRMDKGKTSDNFETRLSAKMEARKNNGKNNINKGNASKSNNGNSKNAKSGKATKKKTVKTTKEVEVAAGVFQFQETEEIIEVEEGDLDYVKVYKTNTGDEDIVGFQDLSATDLEDIVNDEDVDSCEFVQYFKADKAVESFDRQPRQTVPWHLDRINQRTNDLDGNVATESGGTGAGVNVYVVDSGMDISHPAFGGRASNFYNAFSWFGGDYSDGYGHGTHVAGLVGAQGYGLATGASIKNVKVLDSDGGGNTLTILGGLNRVRTEVSRDTSGAKHIVVMSLSGPTSVFIDALIYRLYQLNCLVVVAAGNYNQDACLYTPSRNPAAMTVGATNNVDQLASFSNYGGCVDILAPGTQITSTIPNGQTAAYDGTSMSAPLVAGVAASLWSTVPSLTARQVRRTTQMASSVESISLSVAQQSTPNNFVFSNIVMSQVPLAQFQSGEITLETLKFSAGFGAEWPWATSELDWLDQRNRYRSGSYEGSRFYYGAFYVPETDAVLSYCGIGACEITADGRGNVNGQVTEGPIVGGNWASSGSAGSMTISSFLEMLGFTGSTMYDYDMQASFGIIQGLLQGALFSGYEDVRFRYSG